MTEKHLTCAECDELFLEYFEGELDNARKSMLELLLANHPLDSSDRCMEGEPLRGPHIELPSEKRDREPLVQQESIAQDPRIGGETRLTCTAQEAERLIAAAVRYFEEHRVPRACGALRHEHQQVAVEFNPTRGVRRRVIDVGDPPIGRVLRVDGEVHARDDSFVSPGVVSAKNIDSNDLRRRELDREQQNEQHADKGRHRELRS